MVVSNSVYSFVFFVVVRIEFVHTMFDMTLNKIFTGCAAVVCACFAAAGFTFGTVPGTSIKRFVYNSYNFVFFLQKNVFYLEPDVSLLFTHTATLIAATPALAACNTAFGVCEAACMAALFLPTP